MVANSIQKTVAIDRETTYNAGIPGGDWDSLTANGGVIAVFDLEHDIMQDTTPNKNLKQRPGASRQVILGLKSGSTVSFKFYILGDTSNVAEGVQGAAEVYDEIFKNALGGTYIGFAAGIASGTAALPIVETGEMTTQEVHSWGFFFDTDTSTGYFRKIDNEAADTLTLHPGHDLPFTPDPGGADTINSCAQYTPRWNVLNNHVAADHQTHTMFFKGADTEDNFEPRGVKFGIGIEGIEAGTPTEVTVNAMATSFNDHEGITQPALAQALEGGFGPVVGSGSTTLCSIADVGVVLADQNFWGVIAPTLGIEPMGVEGPNGPEGRHGYKITEESYDATQVKLTVPFDDDWFTDFRAETRKHLLIQVGTSQSKSWAMYFGNLSFAREPMVVDVGGVRGLELTFNANEPTTSITGLTEEEADRARAKFEIIRVR